MATDFNFGAERKSTPEPLEVNFNFGANSFIILYGSSDNFTAIWSSEDASRSKGRLYIGSSGPGASFNIVDLYTKNVDDKYTLSIKGKTGQTLLQEDIVDLSSRGA